MDIKQVIENIKKSKKYKYISEEIIRQKIEEHLKKTGIFDISEADLRDIKAKLHRIHSSFRINERKIKEYIKEKDWKSLLNTNRSAKERLEDYEKIYEKIFEITEKPNSILDLGCGLNPVSIPFMKLNLRELEYYAYDINEAEILAINEFLKLEGIKGKAWVLDLSKIENIKKLPNCDLCLMFKLVDILENKGHKYSEEIIKILAKKCRFIVVSFATKTLGGKRMKFAERGWIERMLSRIELCFEKLVFEEAGEVFYIIKS